MNKACRRLVGTSCDQYDFGITISGYNKMSDSPDLVVGRKGNGNRNIRSIEINTGTVWKPKPVRYPSCWRPTKESLI